MMNKELNRTKKQERQDKNRVAPVGRRGNWGQGYPEEKKNQKKCS